MSDSNSSLKLNRREFVRIIGTSATLTAAGALIQACAPAPTPAASTEANKALVRRYVEQVPNGRRFEVLDEMVSPNYKRYLSPTATPLTIEGQKQRLAGLRAAFPDARLTIDDMIAKGDRVVYRGTVRGTQQAAFQGIAPTGKQVPSTVIGIFLIENGKFVEHWGGPDTMALLQRLGAVVSAGPEKK